MRQLPLPFAHQPEYAGADVLTAASNAAARTWLDRTNDWPAGRLALWGEAGAGKTHLLHVWARARRAVILGGADLRGLLPAPSRPIAVDRAAAADEEALLHLLNSAAEAGWPVLLADRMPPARWATHLADLASRLRAITAVEITPVEDDLLRPLLARLLAARQLAVAEPVQSWLLARLPRSAAAIGEAVARLDRAGLAAGRPITRALAAEALRALLASDRTPADPSADGPPASGDVSATSGAETSSMPAPLLYSGG